MPDKIRALSSILVALLHSTPAMGGSQGLGRDHSSVMARYGELRGVYWQPEEALLKKRAVRFNLTNSPEKYEMPFQTPGHFGQVHALLLRSDSLYASGWFYRSDDVSVNGISLWDGGRWNAVELGVESADCPGCQAVGLHTIGSRFLVTGQKGAEKKVASVVEKVGTNWVQHPDPPGKLATAMVEWQSQLLVATDAGVFRRSATGWERMGRAITGAVSRLAVHENRLWMAGDFIPHGKDTSWTNLMVWQDTGWAQPWARRTGRVRDLEGFQGGLSAILIGTWEQEQAARTDTLIRWTGAEWVNVALPPGLQSLQALRTDGTSLFVLGSVLKWEWEFPGRPFFQGLGRADQHKVFKWDGQEWKSVLDIPVSGAVLEMQLTDKGYILGGSFPGAGGKRTDNLALWDGAVWAGLSRVTNPGPNGSSQAMVSHGGELVFAGGGIVFGGQAPARQISRWNGSRWDSFNGGLWTAWVPDPKQPGRPRAFGSIGDMVSVGNDLYIGGDFDSTADGPVRNIARWDGTSWHSLGSGVPGTIQDLLSHHDSLFIARAPVSTDTDSISVCAGQAVCVWNGSKWSWVGGGIGGRASRLLHYRGALLAIGQFTSATFSQVYSLAGINKVGKWDYHDRWANHSFRNRTIHDGIVYKGRLHLILDDTLMQMDDGLTGSNTPLARGIMQGCTMLVDEKFLYVSCSSMEIPGQGKASFARWDGNGWRILAEDNVAPLTRLDRGSLAIHGGYVYLSGGAEFGSPTARTHYLRWNLSDVNGLKPDLRHSYSPGAKMRIWVPFDRSSLSIMVSDGVMFNVLGRRLPPSSLTIAPYVIRSHGSNEKEDSVILR